MKKIFLNTSAIACFLFVLSCGSKQEFQADLIIDASSSLEEDGKWFKQADQVVLSSEGGNLSYEINIPSAGRYRVEVVAVGEGTVWFEDYIDNKDARTYNITGNIEIKSPDSPESFGKEGSPLNKGLHKIKLHASKNETLIIQKLLFTKMIDHQITPVSMVQGYEGDEWQLVWSDEFEGEGLPDSLKWTFDVGNWGWGNNEPQYYTDSRIENARLENGNLIIEARKNDMGQPWTSARLTTRGKTSFLYGKIEFRAKVPAINGTWAAGWLLGDEYVDELSWPYCGEIDVLECVGNEIDDESGDGINHASCHTRTYYFKEGTQITAITDVKDMVNEYHTYTIEWTPEGITGFVDGNEYFLYDKTADRLEWPFNEPQNIILNLAMGGGMGGEIDPTANAAQFVIDYVRVYGK